MEGCGHLSCDYFLSYGKKGSDLVIELSGNTSGWLAVGFSSDANMVFFMGFLFGGGSRGGSGVR